MKNVKHNINHQQRWKNDRKGIVDVQFNWIFVLIAGFVIFMFIIGIVYSQKRNADTQAGLSAISQITTILKSKQQTADVYSEVQLPRTDISFTCDQNSGIFNFKIQDGERTQLPTEIIFAPQQVNTNKIIVWTQGFSTGFPVNIFSYITTSDSVILIYNDSTTAPYAKLLYDDIPGNMTHKYISSTNLNEYDAFNRKRIICFDNICPSGKDYLNIEPQKGLFSYGDVTFKKNSATATQTKIPYITKAGLYGAIFSDNEAYYKCQMSRVMEQFQIKRSLTEKRLRLIDADLAAGTCENIISVTITTEIIPLKTIGFSSNDITTLYNTVGDIETRNMDLKLGSCPKIY